MSEAILAKIRKCLALAKSANENEAAAAMSKARELMELHGIGQDAVDLADVRQASAKRNRAQRPPQWEVNLARTVSYVFGCEILIDSLSTFAFIGLSARAEVAAYAFANAHRLLKRQRAEYIRTELKRCKPAVKRARADHYSEGWARGVEMAMVCLQDPIECDMAKRYLANISTAKRSARGPQATKSGKVRDDFMGGYDEGQKVRLHRGVGGSDAAAEPALLGGAPS